MEDFGRFWNIHSLLGGSSKKIYFNGLKKKEIKSKQTEDLSRNTRTEDQVKTESKYFLKYIRKSIRGQKI